MSSVKSPRKYAYHNKQKCNHTYAEQLVLSEGGLIQIGNLFTFRNYGTLYTQCTECSDTNEEMVVGGILYEAYRGDEE